MFSYYPYSCTLKNYKILMEEIKNDTKKWKYIPHSGLENILKCLCYPKQSADLVQSLSNVHDTFHRTETNNLKINIKPQETLNSQSNIEKKEQS